jgi:uncharacterized protein
LTPKYVDILIKNQVTFYQITIDGPEQIHDQRRLLRNGRGTWKRIIDNLKYLTSCPNISAAIRVNIDKKNIDSIEELFNELKERGIFHKVSFSFGLVTSFGKVCKSLEDNFLTIEKADAILRQKDITSLLKDSRNRELRPRTDLVGCVAAAQHSFIIGPQGELYKCSKTVGDSNEVCGTIFNIDPENMNLKKWLKFDNTDRAICRECSMLPVCIGNKCPFDLLMDNKNSIDECDREKKHGYYINKLKSLYMQKNHVSKNKEVPNGRN